MRLQNDLLIARATLALDTDDYIRTAMAAHEPKRIEREGMARAAVLIALYDKDTVSHILFQVRGPK